MSTPRRKLLTAVIVSSIVLSAVAFAGASAAAKTTVDGPDEVTKTETFTITSTVEFEETDRVDVSYYSLVLRPADAADKTVKIHFAPDGSIIGTDPTDGVVGNGQLRVDQLRSKTVVTPVDRNGSYGYGYGYGYGSGAVTYEIQLDSKAFKQGDYETFLTVTTENETEQFRSNVETFTIQSPSRGAARGSADDRPGSERNPTIGGDRRGVEANGPAPLKRG